jgi:hypothetical protein
MLEECRLWLLDNSDSGWPGGLCRRRGRGVIALLLTRASTAPVARDLPAVAGASDMRRAFDELNLPIISVEAATDSRVGRSSRQRRYRRRREKRAKQSHRETRWVRLATMTRMALHGKNAKIKPSLTRAKCSSAQQSDWRRREKCEEQSQQGNA